MNLSMAVVKVVQYWNQGRTYAEARLEVIREFKMSDNWITQLDNLLEA